MERIKIDCMVYQDGGDFYDYDTGMHLYKSNLHVKDFDMQTAIAARDEFIKWCKQRNFVVSFK